MELLRIVAMFMILVYHTVYYVFYNYRGDSPVFASMMTLLHIGVPLFVLISGYFGIKPTTKGFIKLYLI
jgi:surface polysaccharide O-acyltransferase-like enzyme